MHPLQVSLSGSDPEALFARVLNSRVVADGLPGTLNVDGQPREITADWSERWSHECQRDVFAAWGDDFDTFVSFSRDGIVKAAAASFEFDVVGINTWLHSLPFEVATFGAIFPEWFARPDFPVAGFGDLHFPLGWGCAFRGEGHRRLVSRRWLQAGSWRLDRGDADVSLVRFHADEQDAEAAFEEAKPAHLRMGISEVGGYIQSDYIFTNPLEGLYLPAERRLKVLVHGRQVSQLEMLDACAARLYQSLGPDRPLDTIAYVFADELAARAHLQELWLRELQCWAFSGGREVRLDTAERPTP